MVSHYLYMIPAPEIWFNIIVNFSLINKFIVTIILPNVEFKLLKRIPNVKSVCHCSCLCNYANKLNSLQSPPLSLDGTESSAVNHSADRI